MNRLKPAWILARRTRADRSASELDSRSRNKDANMNANGAIRNTDRVKYLIVAMMLPERANSLSKISSGNDSNVEDRVETRPTARMDRAILPLNQGFSIPLPE